MRRRQERSFLLDPLRAERSARAFRAAAWPLLRQVGRLYRATRLRKTRIIAITGSFAKTTTARAVSLALGLPDPGVANHGSRLALKLLRTDPRDHRQVLEVGVDRPGQMRRMAEMVRPDVAFLTGIGSDHNRSFPTLEDTLAEKSNLIRALRTDRSSNGGVAVLNADDALALSAASIAPSAVVTYGFSADSNVRATDFQLDSLAGNRFRVHVDGRSLVLRSRLLGRHQVYPLLAGLAAALVEGVDLEGAVRRLDALEPAPGRMAAVHLPSGAALINDSFKGAIEGYVQALDAIRLIPAQRRVLILGDIEEPPRSQTEAYAVIGAALARVPEAVIVHVGENGKKFRSGARKSGLDADDFLCLGPSVLGALERIRTLVRPTDLILVKGRNSQKLDRIVVGLRDMTVRCNLRYCGRPTSECRKCPMLAVG